MCLCLDRLSGYRLLSVVFHIVDLLAQHDVSDWRSEEDGTQRTNYHTNNHGERERTDGVATKDEDSEQHDQRGNRRVNGTREGLVDRVVEQLLLVTLRMQAEILTNTVEHHHGVIDVVTNHRKDGADKRLVNLKREAYPALAKREEADDHCRVDGQSQD